MEQYISKSALIAEIEKRIITYKNISGEDRRTDALMSLKNSLDTLEVKEIDLEKYYHEFLQKEWFGKNCIRTMSEMMAFTAKHFFELGLKAQKGEEI